MAYTSTNFKTKKAFKEAVKAGEQISLFSPGPWAPRTDGREAVEGPQYPASHSWYADVDVVSGIVTKVR